MSYIRKIVSDDEKLIRIVRLHWIYLAQGFFWMVMLVALGIALNLLAFKLAVNFDQKVEAAGTPLMVLSLGDYALYFFGGVGVMVFLIYLFKYFGSEVGLTTRRIIYKTGLIFIKMTQVDIEEIHSEKLNLGLLGALFGYGELALDCRFMGDVSLPAIGHAEDFLKDLHERRARLQDVLSVATRSEVVS